MKRILSDRVEFRVSVFCVIPQSKLSRVIRESQNFLFVVLGLIIANTIL